MKHVNDTPESIRTMRAAIRDAAVREAFEADAAERLGDALTARNYPAEHKMQTTLEKRGYRERALKAIKCR